MAGQHQDRVAYHGAGYALLEVEGGQLFDPRSIGISPQSFPDCARGYQCVYALRYGLLSLGALTVGDQSARGPLPAGARVGAGWGDGRPIPAHLPLLGRDAVAYPTRHILRWAGIELAIAFTGRLLLGRRPIALTDGAASFRSRLVLHLQDGRVVEARADADRAPAPQDGRRAASGEGFRRAAQLEHGSWSSPPLWSGRPAPGGGQPGQGAAGMAAGVPAAHAGAD